MATLLDANVLVAMLTHSHVHNASAERWFASEPGVIATCPVTQGALIRVLLVGGASIEAARSALTQIVRHARHEFWPDDVGYDDADLSGVVGHRQVTDAYLASLARARGGRVATFDRGLALAHPDVIILVPVVD